LSELNRLYSCGREKNKKKGRRKRLKGRGRARIHSGGKVNAAKRETEQPKGKRGIKIEIGMYGPQPRMGRSSGKRR